jgi:hypothetical protein
MIHGGFLDEAPIGLLESNVAAVVALTEQGILLTINHSGGAVPRIEEYLRDSLVRVLQPIEISPVVKRILNKR